MTLGSWALFGFDYFSSSFLLEVLDENVHHVDAFSRLKDVVVAFGILLVPLLPPFFKFSCQLNMFFNLVWDFLKGF
jgi:hypothetical protein